MNIPKLLEIIDAQEKLICFDDFNNHDALKLGVLIAEKVKHSARPVAIRIYLEDILVFQYTMRGKEEWHYGWAERKYQMVKATRRSSFYAMLANKFSGKWQEFSADESKAFACGAFPIKLKTGEILGVVSISGLVDPQDHEVVISALSEYSGVKVPVWSAEDLK